MKGTLVRGFKVQLYILPLIDQGRRALTLLCVAPCHTLISPGLVGCRGQEAVHRCCGRGALAAGIYVPRDAADGRRSAA